ncbi:MAG TPA: heterodisulfide reductase, subunit B [Rhodospirillales bacterium]|nr:heterodisulfide reductase, subunit B [Rhodospirillales bacterium]
MKLSYYPGCTLKDKARNFEDSTISSMKFLGVELEELERWNCCGTVFSLASDDLMRHLAPVRNLIRTKEAEAGELTTTCAMCYNTLKRANLHVKANPDILERMNDFMYDEEVDYEGDVEVTHLMEVLRDKIGYEALSEKVTKPLEGLKVAGYYGCLLTRPREVAFDDVENPSFFEGLIEALGASAVDFPHRSECCASYQTVDKPEIVAQQTQKILKSAKAQGADIVAVSCPLCAFNLDSRQEDAARAYPGFEHIPVVYFTQLMAMAFERPSTEIGLDAHYINPCPVLAEKGFL